MILLVLLYQRDTQIPRGRSEVRVCYRTAPLELRTLEQRGGFEPVTVELLC